MKFIDEAFITVVAGKGGDGALSFRREKCVPFGGPDGGDGGDGGDIYLETRANLNTLADFCYQTVFTAQAGHKGMGANCTGRRGDDLTIGVPPGTLVWDLGNNSLLADMEKIGMRILVAKGGFHGMGNTRFKTSSNRAPRRITKGREGERRQLRLELRLLADVALLGLPNAGKSSLIRAVSAARPKVADYAFTTLHPQLGVVRVGPGASFVMADIPGLIAGAAHGAGLGVAFLKHLNRSRLLLHLVDLAPLDESDPVDNARIILQELQAYQTALYEKPRWLVFSQTDKLTEAVLQERSQAVLQALAWQGPVFYTSAVTNQGLEALCYAIGNYLLPAGLPS
jgi:GTP-binding protein